MADTYNSTNINEWNASTPADTDSIGDVGKAIRQIKKTITTIDESDVNGLTAYLKGTLRDFIVDTITERFKHFYRVGDIICTQNKNNPSEVFGGTWDLLNDGTFLMNSTDTINSDEELDTNSANSYVQTQYRSIDVAGTTLADENDNRGSANNIVYKSNSNTDDKYLVKSPESGYWLYTDQPRWSTSQGKNIAVDYTKVYMWKKVSDEDSI